MLFRLVDLNIVRILRKRKNECMRWYNYEKEDVYQFCGPMFTEYEDAAVNYYIKCMFSCVFDPLIIDCSLKQTWV